MARFPMEHWLHRYGFEQQGHDWWAFEGFPYLTLDVYHEEQTCLIHEWRDQFLPRTAVGERKQEVWDPEEPPVIWTEYRFPWPTTLAEAEAMADAMSWHDNAAPPDTPLSEWIKGVDTRLRQGQESSLRYQETNP